MNVAYVRVSTIDQNEERQVEGLKKYGIEKWFSEKMSGKNMNRPQLQQALDFVRDGDTLFVHDFSRLARSTKDLLDIAERLDKKGVRLVSNKENIDTHTTTGKLMLTLIGAIAEFERANILERQREGIAIAKAKGVYKGRKASIDKIPNDKWDFYYDLYLRRDLSKAGLARKLGVSRPTLEKLLAEKKDTPSNKENMN